ncbi:TetR/AcrR family transcriptional regulator [Solirubrobacter sp. CPCC 204708]|uniref:TetR/AcrR family transcriptional regulator n=2 Tax=Solirubrobacter deserti TaxID=2282478 RepID=A0ABT4RM94_9ACTN|nr:TetR/AcrR family transcriptional regulator [Solirubrobacter deserti]MDA0139543.1 TetR/AcrR family transcriptional regulator [Solirubrobacter deserti]
MGNATIGRPRGFDADEALERAMHVFWEHGYEGACLTALTDAMGINKTSLYAAFGNKEQLFLKVLDRYADGPAGYAQRALEEPTARAVVEALLRGAAETTTRPDSPAGCLGVQAALPASDGNRCAHEALVEWRNTAAVRLEERFRRAVDEGDLPADADPHELATYVSTVAQGIAVQAANGLDRDALQRIVDTTLRQWAP